MTIEEGTNRLAHNEIKYFWRWRDKGGIEDLKKAFVYLGWMIDAAEEANAE